MCWNTHCHHSISTGTLAFSVFEMDCSASPCVQKTRETRGYSPLSWVSGPVSLGSPGSSGEELGLVISTYEGRGQGAEDIPTHCPFPLQRSSQPPHRNHHGSAHRYVLALLKLVMDWNQGATRLKAWTAKTAETHRKNPVLCPYYIAEAQRGQVSCLKPHN